MSKDKDSNIRNINKLIKQLPFHRKRYSLLEICVRLRDHMSNTKNTVTWSSIDKRKNNLN